MFMQLFKKKLKVFSNSACSENINFFGIDYSIMHIEEYNLQKTSKPLANYSKKRKTKKVGALR